MEKQLLIIIGEQLEIIKKLDLSKPAVKDDLIDLSKMFIEIVGSEVIEKSIAD